MQIHATLCGAMIGGAFIGAILGLSADPRMKLSDGSPGAMAHPTSNSILATSTQAMAAFVRTGPEEMTPYNELDRMPTWKKRMVKLNAAALDASYRSVSLNESMTGSRKDSFSKSDDRLGAIDLDKVSGSPSDASLIEVETSQYDRSNLVVGTKSSVVNNFETVNDDMILVGDKPEVNN